LEEPPKRLSFPYPRSLISLPPLFPPPLATLAMDPSQAALQALIQETKALGWNFPEHLDVIEEPPPNQEAFALIGN
jgi:hypothetical protein